jgi:hypothetical protein
MPLSVEAAHVLLVSSCGAYRLQSKVERMKHNMEVKRSTFDTARCDDGISSEGERNNNPE